MENFNEEQIEKIREKGVECAHSTGGFIETLHWGIDDNGGIFAHDRKTVGDEDSLNIGAKKSDITFDELLSIIGDKLSGRTND